jgi:hypothetical protein
MFENARRTWGRLVGRPQELPTVEEERRVWVRFPCDREITCQPASAAKRLPARVQDISLGGISLLVGYPFETGGLLSVELPGTDDGCSTTVLAYVVHVAARDSGEWSVGCAFATELSDQELRSLGARRLKPPASDQRAWVRFPSNAHATYQWSRDPSSRPRPARVLNISPTGAALTAPEAVEAGALLSLELHDPQGNPRLTIMASVTRVTCDGGGEWALGCTFIRELTEKELEALI